VNSQTSEHSAQPILRKRITNLFCVIALIAIALAIGLPRYRVGLDWADEGFLAYGTVRVMEGQIPNRDFVSLQPPLSFYVAAGVFKMFGTSLVSLRILGLSLYVLIPLLIFAISRHFMNAAFSAGAALPAIILGIPYFLFGPLAVWQGITVTLAAIFVLLQAVTKQRAWLALPAGVLTSLSILLRHDQGVCCVLSIIALLIAIRCAKEKSISPGTLGRIFVLWMAGAATIAMACTVFWWRRNALPEMFRQLVVFPLTVYGKTSSVAFPHFDPQLSFAQNATVLLFFGPPVIEILASILIIRQIFRRKFGRRESFGAFLIAWSAFFYIQVLTRSDMNHILVTLPPVFILLAYGASILFAQFHAKTAKTFLVVIFGGAEFCFLWLVSPIALPDLSRCDEELDLPRGGVRSEDGHYTANVIRDLQQRVPPERSILCLPYLPMFYFLSERRNPTRWNYIWPGDQTTEDYHTLIRQAQADPPAAIFINNENNMVGVAPVILDYVHREYTSAGEIGSIRMYFPRPTAP
jgi:hypothetical protein